MANTATSIYLDGTGDYIETGVSLASYNGPFTFEGWFYPTDADRREGLFGSGTNDDFDIEFQADNDLMVFGRRSNGTDYATNIVIAAAAWGQKTVWQHIAVCRTANNAVIYRDGVLKYYGTGTSASGYNGHPSDIADIRLGIYATLPFKGYIDSARISKVSRYGNIDTPTTQLNTWQLAGKGQNPLLPHHTKLLIQANSSTTTSSSIVDETGQHTITVTNNATHSQGKTLFGNTALYFDGTDDRLTIAGNPAHAVAAGEDYSLEFWVNHATVLTSQNNQYWFNQDNDFAWKSYNHSSQDWFQLIVNSTTIVQAPFGSGVQDWTHAAVARVNNVHCAWINGALVAANTTISGDNIAATIPTGALYIGGTSASPPAQDCHGYIDNIRLCVGQSAYTPHFSPYGSQKNVTVSRGGVVTDARHPSANTHAIRMGQAAIGSTAATNANTYCLDFDGTADYLYHNTPNWRSADDRGTIFAWIYKDDNSGTQDIFATSDTATNDHAFIFGILSTGKLYIQQEVSGTEQKMTSTGTSVALNGWHSVAFTSDGDDYKMYLDGAASAFTATSGTDDGDWISSVSNRDNVTIGSLLRTSAVDEFDGKIMQVAYWGGASGTTGVLDADAIAALHAAGKGYDIKGSGNTGNYDSWADDLKGYWRMGNHYLDTPQTIHDASGNGADMQQVSNPLAKTWTTGTTFLEGWQDRGYFSGDQYTTLLLQGAYANGSTTFTDSGPGYKRMLFDGTDDVAIVSSLGSYRSSDTQGTLNVWVKPKAGGATQTMLWVGDSASSAYYLNFRISSSNKIQLVIQWDGSNSVLF